MVDKVFLVTGNKISSLIADENSLKFSSSVFDTAESFKEAFAKKLSLATKVEIKYDSIKSLKKEDNDKDISIRYRTYVGILSDCLFSFTTPADYERFFNFFEKERYFSKRHETLTPLKAIRSHLIGLLVTIAIAVFIYFQAIEIKNGTVEEAYNGKTRAFNYIVGLLGDKGVIAVGTLATCYFLYKIWARFSNPPKQTILLPPNY